MDSQRAARIAVKSGGIAAAALAVTVAAATLYSLRADLAAVLSALRFESLLYLLPFVAVLLAIQIAELARHRWPGKIAAARAAVAVFAVITIGMFLFFEHRRPAGELLVSAMTGLVPAYGMLGLTILLRRLPGPAAIRLLIAAAGASILAILGFLVLLVAACGILNECL